MGISNGYLLTLPASLPSFLINSFWFFGNHPSSE